MENPAPTKGYSQLSADMLKTDEGQTNAVFACFGSAAQQAQMFEDGLTKFLATYNVASSESVTLEDLESLKVKLNKFTMGSLIVNLEKLVKFNTTFVPDTFNQVLKDRNFLMHHFFLERAPELATTEGRMELLSELIAIEGRLELARVMIDAIRVALCEAMNIGAEYPHRKILS